MDDPNRRIYSSISNQSTLDETEIGKVATGIYKGIQVAIKTFYVKKLIVNRTLLLEMKQMRELTHENLVRFIGLCIEEPNIAIFNEFSPRGSLQDIIHNDAMKLDWVFRYAMISDIVEGMVFLHSSVIGYHGHFKSTNCVIDGRFMVKITDYGMNSLYSQISNEEKVDPYKLFWTAPEHLRDPHPERQGSKKGDIYSFAIILQEIITRTGPFERLVKKQNNLLPEDILEKVKMGTTPPFRPELSPEDATSDILDLMRRCWAEQPDDRPTFQEIKSQLKQITKGISSRNFLDNLLSRMEQYANNLEQLVEAKTLSLIDEKKKTDELLYQLLPKYIADELKKGNHIKPEAFESVTIFFSDIVGFTPLAAESTPIQIVDLLNDLYTCFDDIIDHYSAYKVETIGDAYMVVSGLPIRNGNEHAKEIALMSLSLLRAIRKFKVRHRSDRKLQVRIGIHSGPCAAGVVGLKMPRYCLFGDTVNTASRMESNGQAMKIHVSSDTKFILDIFGTFKLTLRGDIEIKGKGVMRTYWLEGETGECHFGKE
ncbi:atrial natriuretic peptide receptor 1-like [Centruroides vittatus]|uniref:atrial natriuretic peptide receptor 1-like n=1 Tax=Centruroides vittatus TaxID=120091 RepID=UPI0035106B36